MECSRVSCSASHMNFTPDEKLITVCLSSVGQAGFMSIAGRAIAGRSIAGKASAGTSSAGGSAKATSTTA